MTHTQGDLSSLSPKKTMKNKALQKYFNDPERRSQFDLTYPNPPRRSQSSERPSNGGRSGEYSVPSGLVHYGFVQSTPFWVSGYEEDPDRPVLTVTFKRKRTPFRVVPVKSSNIMFSYSEAFILQYNMEEPHWADPLEMKFQLVDFLVNRRQGRCFISGKSLTLYQKRRLELGTGVDGLFPVAAESEGWHLLWVCSASRVHSSLCDSGYFSGRAP